MDKNLYEVLGINEYSNEEEIKKAYKKMAMKWHPDRNPHNKEIAEEKFRKINHAYKVLSDKNKKFVNYENNIFENFFKYINKNKSQKIIKELYLDLEDLYFGKQKKLKIVRFNINGDKEELLIPVNIKRGYKDGDKILYKGAGNEYVGKKNEDILFIIREKKHSLFRREKNNLILDININFKDIIDKKKIEYYTIDNIKMSFNCHNEINDWNTKKIIKNKGMPYTQNSEVLFGDLILDINVEFPKFNNYQKKILSGIL